MSKHIHYEQIKQWIEDTTQTVWFKAKATKIWRKVLGGHPAWDEQNEYFVGSKPPVRLIHLGLNSFPEPMLEKPENGQRYYFPTTMLNTLYGSNLWLGDATEHRMLDFGFVHDSSDAAAAHCKALREHNKTITQAGE